MAEELNYIKTFEEEFEPDSDSFVKEYFKLFKLNFPENLPKPIRFLEEKNYRIHSPITNKTYLSAFFSKPEEDSIIAKFSLIEDGADIKKEAIILKNLYNTKVSPKLIHYGELEDGSGVNFLFTSVEGINNNLNGTNPQFWWDENKEHLIDRLRVIHSKKNSADIHDYENIFIGDFFENVLFEEENLFEYIFESDSDSDLLDFIVICKNICLDICSKLRKEDFVLCHNNLCKSSVLFEPDSDEKFKFINFHKSIIAPPAIDLLSIYHRLSLEEDDDFRNFYLANFNELKTIYEKACNKEIDFSVEIRFLNAIQRLLFLIYENNFPPIVLFQSNPMLKFRSRNAELNHLKERICRIARDPNFKYQKEFNQYKNIDSIPIKELLLYG